MNNLDLKLTYSSSSKPLTVSTLIDTLQKFSLELPVRLCVADEESHSTHNLVVDKFEDENTSKEVLYICSGKSNPWVPDVSEMPIDQAIQLRKVNDIVHLATYRDSNWIELACGRSSVESKWGPEGSTNTEDQEVFVADDNSLYTFEKDKATCINCI